MEIKALRYDTTEDDKGKITSAFMTIAVTDASIPGAIARSEHTFTESELVLVNAGNLKEVSETVAAEALDKLKAENESKPPAPISSDVAELTAIKSVIREPEVLAKQAVLEQQRKNTGTVVPKP